MKVVTVITLLFLVLGQSLAYEPSKIYKYLYQGHVLTKVADADRPQFSGVAIKSSISVTKDDSSNEMTVQVGEPQIATFTDTGDQPNYSQMEYQPIQTATALDKPFKVRFTPAGAIEMFVSFSEEPVWVTNFKRGLLSFFQVQLQDSTPESYYTVSEKSGFGECDTDYLITNASPADLEPQSRLLNVTKTRNLEKCKSRFHYQSKAVDSSDCNESEEEQRQYKRTSAVFNYNIRGTSKRFVIERVTLDESTTYSPFLQAGFTHQTDTKFSLELASVESGSIAVSGNQNNNEMLSYDSPRPVNFYANINLEDERHLSSIYQLSANAEQVLSALDVLVKEVGTYNQAFEGQINPAYMENAELGRLFLRVTELLGTLNYQMIQQFYAQVDTRSEVHKKVFWDLISVSGTDPSFMFMKKLITDGDAPAVRIKDYLTRLPYHIKMPSKNFFDEYVNLCKSDKIQTTPAYKHLCVLPLASLIHQHCVKPHAKFMISQQEGNSAVAYKKDQKTCQVATAENYFSSLVLPLTSFSEETSISDRMFNIKLAGELGVRQSIDYLSGHIKSSNEHPSVRAAAMWNLNKVSRIYPSQVKKLVDQFFYDTSEPLEIRIAAFHSLFNSGAHLSDLEMLKLRTRMMQEPSRQLVIYVHSMLESLSKSSSPCGQSKQKSANALLPAIKEALKRHSSSSGLWDSHVSMSSNWLPEFGYGTSSFLSIIFSEDSMAPTNIYYSTTEIMNGLKLTPMSVSIQAHGLDKLIKRVMGINGLIASKDSFMDLFSTRRRTKRQAISAETIKQEMEEILKELKLSPREFSDVYLSVTVSLYGRIVKFMEKESSELKKMVGDDGTIRIPQIKRVIHSFNNHTTQHMMLTFEKTDMLNNEVGLPLFQSMSAFNYQTFKLNTVKLDVEPGFFKEERQGKPATRITASMDARLARHGEFFLYTGTLLHSNLMRVGAGFHKRKILNIPLNISIDANLVDSSFTVRKRPIQKSVLFVRQIPFTFVKTYNPAAPLQGSPEDRIFPLYGWNDTTLMEPFKMEYMTPMGIGVRAEGLHKSEQDWSMGNMRRKLGSLGFYMAKFMYTYSPTQMPLEMRLSTYSTEENPTSELATTFSWRHYHEAEPEKRKTVVDKELELFTGANQIEGTKPTTVSYKLDIVGGSEKERKVEIDLSYSRSADRLLHKWRAAYQRTPLNQANPSAQATNLCWIGQMQFPKYDTAKLLRFELDEFHKSASASSEISFGDECAAVEGRVGSGAYLQARATFDWTDEQKDLIESALGRGHTDNLRLLERNNLVPLYKNCLKSRESNGVQLDGACLQLLRKMTEFNQVNASFSYKDVPERWTRIAKKLGSLYSVARAGYIEEQDENARFESECRPSKGQVLQAQLSANVTSMRERKLNYEFNTPNYHVVYRGLPVHFPTVSAFPLLDSSYYQALRSRAASQICSVGLNQVTTFDNLTYTMPQVGFGCYKLVAQDCSPELNYAVLAAKVGSGKIVKVYVAQSHKVEFVPDKEGKRVSDIKVNGQTVSLEAGKKPLEFEGKIGTRTVQAMTLENNGAYYVLKSKTYKFSIATDGVWLLVQQSKYYSGKSCGLCGDGNGDQLREFKSPISNQRVCKNENDLVWSYVLPSTCAVRPQINECVA